MCVSVIIPTYNRAHLIKRSIQSILDQTVVPLEIIVVDDFSTDNTREVVKSLNSDKVIYTENVFTKGANGARNTGIMLAKGKYIAFQDSDDLWLPTKLERQLEFMENNKNFDMCFCSLLVTNHNKLVPKRKMETSEIPHEILKRNFISTQTILIKTEIAKINMFDEGLKRLQDWDFCIRISKKYKIKHIDEILVHVEIQNDSITRREKLLDAFNQIFNRYPETKYSCYGNKSFYNKILYKKHAEENDRILSTLAEIRFYWNRLLEKLFEEGKL